LLRLGVTGRATKNTRRRTSSDTASDTLQPRHNTPSWRMVIHFSPICATVGQHHNECGEGGLCCLRWSFSLESVIDGLEEAGYWYAEFTATVSAIIPDGWRQAFVAKLRSQIRTEHQRKDEAVGCRYSRHFVIIYRGVGQYAKISWRDGKTYRAKHSENGSRQASVAGSWIGGVWRLTGSRSSQHRVEED
jgi:hypothetical protein